ncbi:MAG: SDR family oxidoreductase [Actinobacteria bacterium]|nr:SDR family oxidoreductase [Actinomycetota bacterium]
MSDRMTGRIALITGGGSGIGAATARLLAREGADVVVVEHPDRYSQALPVAEDIRRTGRRALIALADVADEKAVRDVFETAAGELGVPDCVVAAAGVAGHPDHAGLGSLVDLDTEQWQFVLDINLNGVFFTIREGARRMIDASRPGSIVTLASVAAKIPTAGVYSVSKAAVWMLTKALALETAPHGVRVNAVGPGYIRTPMLDDAARLRGGVAEDWFTEWKSRIPIGRLGEPEDVALTVLFLASDDARYLTGSLLHPDGGITARYAGG